MHDPPRHQPVRRWRTVKLKVWCSCGIRRWPCPDELAGRVAPPEYWAPPAYWQTRPAPAHRWWSR